MSTHVQTKPERSQLRILLVDDHELVRSAIKGTMQLRDGFDVVGEASTADEALELAPDLAPDILVMDIDMPGMICFDAVRKLRKPLPDMRVIFLSAYDSGTEENDELCNNIPGPQCGGDGFDEADGEGYVVPHAGLHGEAELERKLYSWGDPVAMVTIRMMR